MRLLSGRGSAQRRGVGIFANTGPPIAAACQGLHPCRGPGAIRRSRPIHVHSVRLHNEKRGEERRKEAGRRDTMVELLIASTFTPPGLYCYCIVTVSLNPLPPRCSFSRWVPEVHKPSLDAMLDPSKVRSSSRTHTHMTHLRTHAHTSSSPSPIVAHSTTRRPSPCADL